MTPTPRAVTSNQQGIHEHLHSTVHKHLQHRFRKPYAPHNVQAFEQANAWLQQQRAPLILDSFCGVGESSARLAARYPDCAVIGIDKSAARLGRHHRQEGLPKFDNYLLVRADADDFWRLALDAGWRPERHFILYPNPWPKSAHLQRRCHGSPLFPSLLALGGQLELRSNWQIYVEEFAEALRVAGREATCERFRTDSPMTAFERKYLQAGQALWRCLSTLSSAPDQPL